MLHTAAVDELLQKLTAPEEPVIREMEARASATGFPTVGAEVGSFLRWLVVAAGVLDVFECGSGYGYSSYWIAGGLPEEGSIVLTEIDEDELADAKAYFADHPVTATTRFEQGDALEILAAEETTYDLILLDHENERYTEGFEIARKRCSDRGIIVADNVLHSWEFSPSDLSAVLDGDPAPSTNPSLAGIAAYIEHVAHAESFETCVLPIGEGILVSVSRP